MIAYLQPRDPVYNVKSYLYKTRYSEDGSRIYHDEAPFCSFFATDDGFRVSYENDNGHIKKISVGRIETLDLKEDAVVPDDLVEYGGKKYKIIGVTFEDVATNKFLSNKPNGKTTLELEGI